ncbi:hypothetical protein AB6809_29760 [Paraburkholderia sp. RCC_158]|uniref:hypothetical protein n=1 Tax=Paraburkholderia sp. RCC_158 TaxID=3239220 RepID=UPI00352611D0
MRGVLQGSATDMRYSYNREGDRMEVTITMIVDGKPNLEDTDYIPYEGIVVCFGGALPQPMRPLYEKPVADATDERVGSW